MGVATAFCVGTALSAFAAPLCCGQAFTTLPGATIQSLADNGLAAGTNPGPNSRSALWRWESGFQVFGNEAGFLPFNYASAISGDGRVAAGVNSDIGVPARAYRWSGPGTYQTLGQLSGYEMIEVRDADFHGSVIVGHSLANQGLIEQAWVWSETAGLRGIGTTRGGRSDARGVSGDGSIVVGVSAGGPIEDAFYWTASSGMHILSPLAGSQLGEANAINSNGSIIVGSSGLTTTACVWINGAVQSLGTPAGYLLSYATSVSDDGGVIVGLAEVGPGGPAAYVWTPGNGPQRLTDYLTSFGVELPPDVRLRGHLDTLKVSADGKTFSGEAAGIGFFVATVPSPGVAVALSLSFLLRRRQR